MAFPSSKRVSLTHFTVTMIFTAMLSNCGPVKPTGRVHNLRGGNITGADANNNGTVEETSKSTDLGTSGQKVSKQATYDSFETTLFPLLVENCGSCHGATTGPKFAISDDLVTSHDELVDSGKIKFESPTESRLVEKVGIDRHNCWGDCEANSGEILTALEEWVKSRAATPSSSVVAGSITTGELSLGDIRTYKIASPDDTGTIAFEAESGEISGNFIISVDPVTQGQVISSEEGGFPTGERAAVHSADTGLSSLTFEIEIQEPGSYKMNLLAKQGNNNQDNEFFIRIDNEEMKTLNIAGRDLNWQEMRYLELPRGEQQFINWDAGRHTVTFYQSSVGAALDKIIITKNMIEDLDAVTANPLNFPTITYDLKGILNIEAKFAVNLMPTATEGTYTVQNPSIINPNGEMIKIRGIYPLIDGEFDEQNSIFKYVDVDITEKITILSGGASILLLDENASVSFSFDVLETK